MEFLKERYNVPIVGMIDGGVNAAILESENKKIAVMGSDFTINSNIYKENIKKFFSKKIVDSSIESVIELFRVLGQKDLLKEGNKKGRIEFYINGDRDEFKKVARRLFEEKDLRNMFLIY